MDPVCHTLVGAALGATGLEKRTRFGRSTLLIAANIPDVDFVLYFTGNASSYAFRRGITHGIPAIFVLAGLLAAAMLLLSRLQPRRYDGPDAALRWLVILSLIGVASHPTLDWLNNYGMRWLMPMADTWFYGDTLFIIDLVVWATLGTGVWLAYRAGSTPAAWYRRPASIALGVFVAYVAFNMSLTRVAEGVALAAAVPDRPLRVMASPVPANPLRRDIVYDFGSEYRFGRVVFAPAPRFLWDDEVVRVGDPALLERARATRDGGWFLTWSRFPFVVSAESGDAAVVTVGDARYVRDPEEERLRQFGAIVLQLRD